MAYMTPTAFPLEGLIRVIFDNPGSATTPLNRLRRNGVILSSAIPRDVPDPDAAVYRDYNVPSGVQVSYVGNTVTTGGEESAPTAPITATLTLSNVWIHHVAKNSSSNLGELGVLELLNPETQSQKVSREGNILRLAAVEKPRIKSAPHVARTVECPIKVLNGDRTTVMPLLEAMLWSNELFCFRNPDGNLMFCTIDPNNETSTDLHVDLVLKLTESAYDEEESA
jgi:hypothetical protein